MIRPPGSRMLPDWVCRQGVGRSDRSSVRYGGPLVTPSGRHRYPHMSSFLAARVCFHRRSYLANILIFWYYMSDIGRIITENKCVLARQSLFSTLRQPPHSIMRVLRLRLCCSEDHTMVTLYGPFEALLKSAVPFSAVAACFEIFWAFR